MTEEDAHDEPESLALPPPARRDRERLAWLILLLLVVVVIVGSSPFWAPALASLLPWSPSSQTAVALAPLEQRLDEVGRRQAALERQLGQIAEELQGAR